MMVLFVQLIDSYFFIRTICTFSIKILYSELSIINPTSFIFEKYKSFGKKNGKFIQSCSNFIDSKIGGFIETDIRFRDKVMFYKIAEDGFYISK